MNLKLNNRGWGLSDFLIICSVIIICLLFSSVMVIRLSNGLKENLKTNNTNTEENTVPNIKNEENENNDITPINYSDLESILAKDAIKYIEEVYKNNISNNLFIVDYPHLLEVDSDLKNEMTKDNCNGYVESKKNGENIEFTPYLKCDNYSTEGVKDYYLN